jgi:hypothetical protein
MTQQGRADEAAGARGGPYAARQAKTCQARQSDGEDLSGKFLLHYAMRVLMKLGTQVF